MKSAIENTLNLFSENTRTLSYSEIDDEIYDIVKNNVWRRVRERVNTRIRLILDIDVRKAIKNLNIVKENIIFISPDAEKVYNNRQFERAYRRLTNDMWDAIYDDISKEVENSVYQQVRRELCISTSRAVSDRIWNENITFWIELKTSIEKKLESANISSMELNVAWDNL